MADTENRPAADRAESARRARSNYLLYLVGMGAAVAAPIFAEIVDAWGAEPGAPPLFLVDALISLLSVVSLITGLVRAYMGRKRAGEAAKTHLRVQIRTFWISLLYGFVVSMSTLMWTPEAAGVVWWITSLAIAAWFVTRCIKGLRHLSRQEPYPNPGTWLW